MADEAVIAPSVEQEEVKEGTVESEIIKQEPEVVVEDKKTQETVPLAVYLDLKEDLKDYKRQIKEAKTQSSKSTIEIEGLEDLASKYPDVNSEFIQDMLSSATSAAEKKIEAKYSPIIERQEAEKKQAAFDKAFDNLFDKTLQENPDLPKGIDKDAIKALATTPQYRNVPLSDILLKMYPSTPSGKSSSENEARSGADVVDDVVSFDKITPEQKTRIMSDEKTRKEYFNWLDTQTGR